MTISQIVRLGLSGLVRRVAEGEQPQSSPSSLSAVPARALRSVPGGLEKQELGPFRAVVAEIAAEAKGEAPWESA